MRKVAADRRHSFSQKKFLAAYRPQGFSQKRFLAADHPQGFSQKRFLVADHPQGFSQKRFHAADHPQGISLSKLCPDDHPQFILHAGKPPATRLQGFSNLFFYLPRGMVNRSKPFFCTTSWAGMLKSISFAADHRQSFIPQFLKNAVLISD